VVAVILVCPVCEAWQLDAAGSPVWALGPSVVASLVVEELNRHIRSHIIDELIDEVVDGKERVN
jgi:hypothetical protein